MRKLTLKKFIKGLVALEDPKFKENAQKAAEKMKAENGLDNAIKIISEHFFI